MSGMRQGLNSIKFVIIIIAMVVQTQQSSILAQAEVHDSFPEPGNGNTYVIAHRGVHIGIPENTLAAYREAIELGCDFVEIDVRRTKDGRIVSVHNSTVDAYVEGVTGKVKDFTLSELKQMNIGKRVGPGWENERIPSIEEILQLCRGQIGIYLDLKEALVPDLVKVIKDYGMERDVVWCIPATRMDAIMKVKNLCSTCIPMPDPGPEENIEWIAKQVKPQVIAPVMKDFSENYVKIAHEYGIKVFVDEDTGDEAEWTQILDWGADGIQTDNPGALIRFLSEQEKWMK
jgi:glycerophosphoryl diester phosphodiesterase